MARQRRKSGARPRRTQSQFIEGILEALKRFCVARALDIAGIALILLALAMSLALISHSPQDPSFTVATSKHAKNWLGPVGSYSSDFLLQTFGAASILLVMPWFAWGTWLTFLRRADKVGRPYWLHGFTWLLAAMLFATFASALPLPANNHMTASGVGVGGLFGDFVLGRISSLLPVAQEGLIHWISGALALVLGALAFGYTVGLTGRDFALATGAGGRASWQGLRLLVRNARKLTSHVGRSQMPMMPRVLRRRINLDPDQADNQAVFDGGDWNHDFVPEPMLDHPRRTERPQRVVQRMEPKLKAGAREKAEAQSKLDLGDESFRLPELGLLAKPKPVDVLADLTDEALEQNARLLEGVLQDFGIKGEIINVFPGPVVTLYELEPAPGIKSSRVIGLADDIARSMSAVSARVAVVPGRNAIGIELPNRKREMVVLRELLAHESFEQSPEKLLLALGKTIGGEPVVADLARMPHLLIAGTTGSGKSVAINTMILSLVYRLTPAQCKLILIDPKMLELSVYDGIPHLLAPVVTEPKKAIVALKWVVREMEDRYRKMSKLGVRNITGYNQRMAEARESGEELRRQVQTGFDRETGEPVYEEEILSLGAMPFVVVIIDEMADLMMVAGKDIEGAVQRLAQMARAAGIHLIMATQRPSVDVITGTIKANFPTRISFQVTSKIDSRTILGEQGAEQLLGQGDMLYMMGGGRIKRVHGPFVSDMDVEKVVSFLKTQGTPEYLDAITAEPDEESEGFDLWEQEGIADELYDRAVAIIARDRKASTSYIQRKLQIGYNRAARLMERMESEGVVGAANHAGKREIMVGDQSA